MRPIITITITSIFLLVLPLFSFSQLNTGDCINSIPVCSPSVIIMDSVAWGMGDIYELNGGNYSGCLTNGENYSTWFKIMIDSPGVLIFKITPLDIVDYDFTIFDITNTGCQSIIDGVAPEVRCNFAVSIGHNITGLDTGYINTVSGIQGDQFLAPLVVDSGQVYALLVDNFQNSSTGFEIDFTESTARLGNLITLTEILFTSVTPMLCRGEINVFFDSYIDCSSISSDFSEFELIKSDSVIIPITNVICSDFVVLSFDTLLQVGDYKLILRPGTDSNSIATACGNVIFNTDTISFSITHPYVNALFDFEANSGSGDVKFFNQSTGANSYLWDLGDGRTSLSQNPRYVYPDSGSYTVCLTANYYCFSDTYCLDLPFLTLGVEDMLMENFNLIYNNGLFNIENNTNSDINFRLYNMSGQLLKSNSAIRQGKTSIDVSYFPAGIYLAQFINGNTSVTKKIVIQ